MLGDLQASIDTLPPGTVLAPPTEESLESTIIYCPVCGGSHTGHHLCKDRFEKEVEGVNNNGADDDSDINGVEFGDPKLMSHCAICGTAPCNANTLGPHRQQDEPWNHYINRRINDAPDAAYQDRHQMVRDWVKRHSLPEGVTQEQYNRMRCVDRESADLPAGLLTVHGYLWRDAYGATYAAYIDSKGQKFDVDEWEAEDRTTGPNVVEVPYLLHCPRVGQRPDLNADSCGYFLVSELNKQGVLTRDDQLISLTATEGMDALVGKRVRVSCTVEYLREAYYDGGSCYDRVYLAPKDAVEIDPFGRSAEDRKRLKEMFRRPKVYFDDELDELMSGGTKG
jgi:hypothetical protein